MQNVTAQAFKYGLNVFFNPKTLGFDLEDFVISEQAPTVVKAPPSIACVPFAEAMQQKKYAAIFEEIINGKDERAPQIVDWHRAHIGNGVLIHIPAHAKTEAPIRLDLTLGDAHRVENIVVIADERSEVTIVEHLSSKENLSSATRSAVVDIIAGAHAKVTHISVQNFSNTVSDFSAKRTRLAKNASVRWIECVFGADYAQSRVSTRLEGEGASSHLMAMWFGAGRQKFDLRHTVHHLASRTTSNITTRGALDGHAKTIYRGLVRIDTGTVGCSGHQKEDTLLLGPDVEIDAMPDLEIAANDVRCGHSASASRLDKEKMFYMMSRGLSEADARKTLIEGFFAPIVHDMRDSGLEDMVNCLIASRL